MLPGIKPGADLSYTEFRSQESDHREVVPVGRVLSWPVSKYAVFKQELTAAKGSLQQKELVPSKCYVGLCGLRDLSVSYHNAHYALSQSQVVQNREELTEEGRMK